MMIAILIIAAQVAPDTPTRISILTAPCPSEPKTHDEIVVCAASGDKAVRLPLPNERPPVGPLPLNPALMVDPAPRPQGGTPCAATQWGCQVGFGPPLMPIVNGAIGLAKRALAKRPDKSGRIAIDLDDPAPSGSIK